MAVVTRSKGSFRVKAYRGDAKTLLAFNLDEQGAKGLAGFTIQTQPSGKTAYYLLNQLQFKYPSRHAQDSNEPPNSTINAPIHKFRWVHVPGSFHQGIEPVMGDYTYTVTPRYFDPKGSLLPVDPKLSVSVVVKVAPFQKAELEVGFTRGFTQSQAFVHHFGAKALIRPKGDELLFDTTAQSGANAAGAKYTYADEYRWLGYTARDHIFELLDSVIGNKSLRLDMFAYDLNEPDVIQRLLTLAKQGRVRLILDNAALHHSATAPKPEDEIETLFNAAVKKGSAAGIVRGSFNRYAHDKVMIVSDAKGPLRVLTGSTNFSVTGLYVNSNHVLVFHDRVVAAKYSEVFENAWINQAKRGTFQPSPLAASAFPFDSKATPKTEITFAPHPSPVANQMLGDIAQRIATESEGKDVKNSVFFAVMQLDTGTGPVLPALTKLHSAQNIFSYGISDTTSGIRFYAPRNKNGVLVTGKPTRTKLPPPFDQVPGVGIGHQIHHKFIVCGFNTKAAVVYCGSSNLTAGGEEANGDNLLAIHDADIATVFTIEAVALIDHFDFLDRYSQAPAAATPLPAAKQQAAAEAGWFLSTTDRWTIRYFDPEDLRCVDRQLFG